MPVLVFKGGSEYIKLDIIKRNKVLLASSKTGYKYVNVAEKLYDSPQEKAQCKRLSDVAFYAFVALNFKKQGYQLIEKIG